MLCWPSTPSCSATKCVLAEPELSVAPTTHCSATVFPPLPFQLSFVDLRKTLSSCLNAASWDSAACRPLVRCLQLQATHWQSSFLFPLRVDESVFLVLFGRATTCLCTVSPVFFSLPWAYPLSFCPAATWFSSGLGEISRECRAVLSLFSTAGFPSGSAEDFGCPISSTSQS